jgi:histidinol-phosphatase (PHP family)
VIDDSARTPHNTVNRQSTIVNRTMLATYHNHTRWSDGKATPQDVLAAARSMGIAELGLSDHWVLHPRKEEKSWAMATGKLSDYVRDILKLKDDATRQAGTCVLLGLEVDWFPGHGLPIRLELDKHPFDYLIGSCHEVELADIGAVMIDMSAATWEKLSEDHRNDMHRQYWRNQKSMAESGLFDIVAHIDLPKKFGFCATCDLSREIAEALDAIAEANRDRPMVVEINTAGWHKPCNCAYPTLDILKALRRRNIPVTISADAHLPEHLLRDFDRAAQRLSEAGYTHVARFSQREVRFEPLAEAVPVPA